MKLSTFILITALVLCFTTSRAESKTMTMVVDGKPIITITVSEEDEPVKEETEEEPDCE